MSLRKTRTFNVLFTEEDHAHLVKLADAWQCSMGNVIRKAVQNAYMHCVAQVPTCPAGNPCFAPHMIPRVQPSQFHGKE